MNPEKTARAKAVYDHLIPLVCEHGVSQLGKSIVHVRILVLGDFMAVLVEGEDTVHPLIFLRDAGISPFAFGGEMPDGYKPRDEVLFQVFHSGRRVMAASCDTDDKFKVVHFEPGSWASAALALSITDGQQQPPGAAETPAITARKRRMPGKFSILRTVMINGRPLGKVTAGEARRWAAKQDSEVRKVEASLGPRLVDS
jgi:hypothetical protein